MYHYYDDEGPTRDRDEDMRDRADYLRTERKDREMEELWAKSREEQSTKPKDANELETN
jgi:hypothetical protein